MLSVQLTGPAACGPEAERSTCRRLAVDTHLGGDQARLVRDAVVVHEILEAVSAVRDAGDGRAHRGFRAVENAVGRRLEPLRAETLRQPQHTGRADIERGQLRLEIAAHLLRFAGIGVEDAQQRPVDPPGLDHLAGRNPQPLLVDLARARVITAGRAAADIGVVCQRARNRDPPAPEIDGLEGQHVRQVLPAGIGVVGDDDIALPPVRERDGSGEDSFEAGRHGVQVDGDAGRLRDISPLRVEHGGRIVERFAHDGGPGRAPDGDIHVLRRRDQRVADDLDVDGAQIGHLPSPPRRATRWPPDDIARRHPGGTRSVAWASSTMTGPSTASGSRSRS